MDERTLRRPTPTPEPDYATLTLKVIDLWQKRGKRV